MATPIKARSRCVNIFLLKYRMKGETLYSMVKEYEFQGGRSCANARTAFTDRSGSSTTGRTPNIRYFVAKLGIVAIYALFERLS